MNRFLVQDCSITPRLPRINDRLFSPRSTCDLNKNKTSETISGDMADYGFSTTAYDNEDRLTAWNRTDGNLDQSWNLSKEGDWDSFTENTAVQTRTHSAVHELLTLDSQPLTHDAKGNLTTNQNGHTYTWDFDNRMASATVPAGSSEGVEGTHTYTYDALGAGVALLILESRFMPRQPQIPYTL